MSRTFRRMKSGKLRVSDFSYTTEEIEVVKENSAFRVFSGHHYKINNFSGTSVEKFIRRTSNLFFSDSLFTSRTRRKKIQKSLDTTRMRAKGKREIIAECEQNEKD